ncbi:MAG TPA: hypothetical protein VFJ19_02550 [Nocardioidaceae bacterium]|nr:hypothetical protein [Nocardioidaceae bacterium]
MPRQHRLRRPWQGPLAASAWVLVTLAGLAATVLPWTPQTLVPAPEWLPVAGAVTITVTYTYALASRTGGRPAPWSVLALVLSILAAGTRLPVLMAGAAVCTAVLGALLAVMLTVSAARYWAVVVECALATLLAVVAGFAAQSYGAQVSPARVRYVAMGLALFAALVLVYRLAAGRHGLGRRGWFVVLGGIGVLALSLAYSEALTHWGSPELVTGIRRSTADVRSALHAVPRPTEFLLGFPALAWGISTRARRRQGWWGCGFGAVGLALVATTLLDRRLALQEAGLSVGYSLLIGLVLGFLLVRIDRFLSGTRGRRARRAEKAAAHRPEPGRLRALM